MSGLLHVSIASSVGSYRSCGCRSPRSILRVRANKDPFSWTVVGDDLAVLKDQPEVTQDIEMQLRQDFGLNLSHSYWPRRFHLSPSIRTVAPMPILAFEEAGYPLVIGLLTGIYSTGNNLV